MHMEIFFIIVDFSHLNNPHIGRFSRQTAVAEKKIKKKRFKLAEFEDMGKFYIAVVRRGVMDKSV